MKIYRITQFSPECHLVHPQIKEAASSRRSKPLLCKDNILFFIEGEIIWSRFRKGSENQSRVHQYPKMWSSRCRAPAKHAPPRVTWAPNRNNSSNTAGSSNMWPFRAPSRLHSKNGWRGIGRGGSWNISTWSNSPSRVSDRQELHQNLASHRKLHRTPHQTCVCDLETAARFRRFGHLQAREIQCPAVSYPQRCGETMIISMLLRRRKGFSKEWRKWQWWKP